ncbi:hypothetical protein ABMA27_002982 [Loxostege sticticalis]|uniref:Endonuclease/exonuclease/phosphatase domain-containing protein n=1 Tax=Loxostege sticticalis TaxID=481309 RepID=A0ABR3HRL3_LOXSC
MADSLISDLDNFSVSESRACDTERCKLYLTSYNSPFTILTQNIQSIFKNLDNFSIFQQRLNINCDVIVLTECWLKNKNIPLMTGYSAYNSKDNYNKSDGIVVFTKDSLNVTVEEPSMSDCSRLLIKIGSEIAILAIYRPPSFKNTNNFIASLNSVLPHLSSYKNVILIGDININILSGSKDPSAQEYLNLCSYHGLLPAHTLPTHKSGSCLDHVMMKSNFQSLALSRREKKKNSTITDHSAVLLTLNNKSHSKTRTQTLSKLNINKLEEDLCRIDFNPIYNSADAETSMCYLINNVQHAILKNTMSIRQSRKNHNIKPWITPGLIRCMRHRDKLHMKAKANPTNVILQYSYKRYRNFCNNILKKVKSNYEKKELEKAGTNSKKIWNFIKKSTHLTKQRESSSSLLQIHSTQLTSVNIVNDFFVNIGKNLASKLQNHIVESPTNTLEACSTPAQSFVLLDTDESEVERIIIGLKDDSAVGWDNISNKILKQFKHILTPPLTFIFRQCLATGIFPKCLKKAVVVPVYKSGRKDQITNYRPISILSATSKILEKIINRRLVQYLEKQSILSIISLALGTNYRQLMRCINSLMVWYRTWTRAKGQLEYSWTLQKLLTQFLSLSY